MLLVFAEVTSPECEVSYATLVLTEEDDDDEDDEDGSFYMVGY